MGTDQDLSRRKLVIAGGALLGGGTLWWGVRRLRPVDEAEIGRRAAAIAAHHGVAVSYGSPDQFYVPPHRRSDSPGMVLGHFQPAALQAVLPALEAIERELDAYPPGFYRKHCPAIFICGELTFDGVPAGGTYGARWIVLSAPLDDGDDGIADNARRGVHHEFSSLIWHEVLGLPTIWGATMPPGWQPLTSNAEALAAGKRRAPDPSTGFLSAYGATTSENDFNIYAQTTFLDPKWLRRKAEAHPIVARKAGLFLDAYTGLDPRFAATFDGLGLRTLREQGAGSLHLDLSVSPVAAPRPILARPPP